MLQDRQLIHLVAAVVQQALHEFRSDRGAHLFDRLSNEILELGARERRHEKLAGADRLRKAVEPCAIANEIGAHRDQDMDMDMGIAIGLQQDSARIGPRRRARAPFRREP